MQIGGSFVSERESMSFDVVIVGAGVAGLSAAIRLKQCALARGDEVSIVVLEKGSEIGAHVLSGAIIDPVGLDQLLPDWRTLGAPLQTRVASEWLSVLTARKSLDIPAFVLPRVTRHDHCYVGSLGALTKWLGEQAALLGVEIFPGFAAAECLYDEAGALKGVATPDQGLDRQGQPTSGFMRGVELLGRTVIIAEGARGSLAGQLIKRFRLDEGCSPTKYALGLKELWQIPADLHRAGHVRHLTGWPLPRGVGGGGFVYHYGDNLVSLGLVVHADYKDPALSPYDLLQRLKTHPSLKSVLTGGKRIGYGARTLSVGGFDALPQAVFPGGMLIGCAAGLFDMARLKGVHNAILSGIAAAQCCMESLQENSSVDELKSRYQATLERVGVVKELRAARKVKPLLARYGPYAGGGLALLDLWSQQIFKKSLPVSRLRGQSDRLMMRRGGGSPPPVPSWDGILSFDKPSSLGLAGVFHDENQPPHLVFRNPERQLQNVHEYSLEPAQYYCPAGVYELRDNEQSSPYIHISSSNCLHCKMCDIKDPANNLKWTMPPSGGPTYVDM